MIIVHISDTHGRHTSLSQSIEAIENIDVLVHSGDFSDYGIPEETAFFLDWFRSLPSKYKILIAGNHDDAFFEADEVMNAFDLSGIHYLIDESIEINGMKFYGSPWTPSPFGGSFTFYPGEGEPIWEKIPDDVDVLITHTPKYNVLDMARMQYRIQNLGCKHLQKRIEQLPNLKAHLFGHIHEANGIVEKEGIKHSNAATKLHVLWIDNTK